MQYDDFRYMRAAPPRAHRRQLLKALRASGCDCNPTFDEDEHVDAGELGGFSGGWVHHADDCALPDMSGKTLFVPLDRPK